MEHQKTGSQGVLDDAVIEHTGDAGLTARVQRAPGGMTPEYAYRSNS